MADQKILSDHINSLSLPCFISKGIRRNFKVYAEVCDSDRDESIGAKTKAIHPVSLSQDEGPIECVH